MRCHKRPIRAVPSGRTATVTPTPLRHPNPSGRHLNPHRTGAMGLYGHDGAAERASRGCGRTARHDGRVEAGCRAEMSCRAAVGCRAEKSCRTAASRIRPPMISWRAFSRDIPISRGQGKAAHITAGRPQQQAATVGACAASGWNGQLRSSISVGPDRAGSNPYSASTASVMVSARSAPSRPGLSRSRSAAPRTRPRCRAARTAARWAVSPADSVRTASRRMPARISCRRSGMLTVMCASASS